MKRIWISLIAAGLLTIAAIAPAAGQNIFSVPLDDVDDSGVTGGASIRGVDGGVEITVFISAGDEGGTHPVHIHDGTCEELGDVAWPLENIEDGESVTTLEDVSLADLMTGDYAINAHQSEDEMDVYVMCGNVPAVEGIGGDDEDDAADEGDDAASDEDDDAASDDEDDAASDEDDAASEDEDEGTSEDDDEAATDDEDDAVEEDDDAAAEDDEDMAEEDDEAATDEDEDGDDVEDMVPATGGAGMNAESAVVLMTLLGGATLGGGLMIRRRFAQA